MRNALLLNEEPYTEMRAVQRNNHTMELRVGPEKVVQHHNLALGSRKVGLSPARFGTGSSAFTPAEMRHNFAIWAVKDHADTGPKAAPLLLRPL
jgi:hypothetical protein